LILDRGDGVLVLGAPVNRGNGSINLIQISRNKLAAVVVQQLGLEFGWAHVGKLGDAIDDAVRSAVLLFDELQVLLENLHARSFFLAVRVRFVERELEVVPC